MRFVCVCLVVGRVVGWVRVEKAREWVGLHQAYTPTQSLTRCLTRSLECEVSIVSF